MCVVCDSGRERVGGDCGGSGNANSNPTERSAIFGTALLLVRGRDSQSRATSSREQSPPNHMARHRTLRRAMASASAKMPRRFVSSGDYDRLELRGAECAETACRRQAALQGASGATRPQITFSQRRCANNRRLVTWCVTELYSAQWRRRSCREDGLLGGTNAHTSEGRSSFNSFARVRYGQI